MLRSTCLVPALLVLIGGADVLSGAETTPAPAPVSAPVPASAPAPGAETAPVAETSERAAVIRAANHLAESGHFTEALLALNNWLKDHPKDLEVRSYLLSTSVAQKEAEIRQVLQQQAGEQDLLLADPDYAVARSQADEDVRNRLQVVEYLLSQNRYTEAAQGCNAILRDHPKEPAVLTLKFRILNTIVAKERAELTKEYGYRRGEALNDVLEDEVFPRDQAKVKRQIFIFQEDIDEAERAKVKARLQERITLNQDQAKVWDVMRTLFAVSGINYVVLDSSVGEETVSLHLVDDTVESALNAVGKLAKVRFSYTDGTVFVSSDADDGLVTEIIRLRSGLTNVEAKVEMTAFNPSAGNGQNGANGGGQNNRPPPVQPGAQPGAKPGAPGDNLSDLEKLLAKLPDVIVGWQDTHKWHLDRKSNTLYLRANPWVISEVKRLLHAMDYDNVQVLIESRFVEVSEEALRQIGVDWGAFQGTNPANANWAGGVGNPITPATLATAGAVPVGTNTVITGLLQQNGFTLNATLKALESTHQADTLAEPKILTLNNAQGSIEITRTETYTSGVTFQTFTNSSSTGVNNSAVVTNSGQVPQPQFSELKEGYQLLITPSIARNSDVITLKLKPTVQKILPYTEVEVFYQPSSNSSTPKPFPIQKPNFASRTLETVLHVQNGRTLALGGLSDALEDKLTVGTPFIQNIPILGWLFKTERRETKRKNLIILVTAKIVDPSGANVGDELRHLRDTAQILIPASGVDGMDPTKPAMTHPEEPAGPSAPPVGSNLSTPREPGGQKGRRP